MQGWSKDDRRFPGHEEVLRYLQAFAERAGVLPHVRFNTRVTRVTPVATPNGTYDGERCWEVAAAPVADVAVAQERAEQTNGAGSTNGMAEPAHETTQAFDALMVCNGHYAEPRVPPVDGMNTFGGRCEHSHNYRRPEGYKGLRVVTVGAHASGVHQLHMAQAHCCVGSCANLPQKQSRMVYWCV